MKPVPEHKILDNTKLSQYYDGWEIGMDAVGEQSWFFNNVPESLRDVIVSIFNEVNPTYLCID